MGRLVIDGNSVYEIDEECERKKRERKGQADETASGMGREKDHDRTKTGDRRRR